MSLPYNMKAAMLNGLLSSNLVRTPDPLFNCPTGNCTWAPFSSLAVHANCVDMSSEVRLNCSNQNFFKNSSIETCNFFAVSETPLDTSGLLSNADMQTFMVLQGSFPDESFASLVPYANYTAVLSLVQWVKGLGNFGLAYSGDVTNRSVQASDYYIKRDLQYEAMRCAFYFSVDEIVAEVVSGAYSEQIQQTYVGQPQPGALPSGSSNGTNFYFRTDSNWTDATFRPPFSSARDITFTVSADALLDIVNVFGMDSSFLTGTINTESNAFLGSTVTTMLWQSSNVTEAMLNMASYMTTALRSNDSLLLQAEQKNATVIAPGQTIIGTAYVQQQYVSVRYRWLLLPLIMLFLATVLLAITITITIRTGVGVWKSSPLALFFHARGLEELPPSGSHKRSDMRTVKGMQEAASKFNVRVRDD